jgi:Gas vesicle synthesis protein GvpL/GvpF
MTAWHVYGILGQQPRDLKLEGLHGAPVHVLGGPNVWALASEVTTGLNVIPTNALDPIMHHKVIEAALERFDVLPARFTAPIEHRMLLNRLEADSAKHLSALARIRGSLEFGIRAQIDPGLPPVVGGLEQPVRSSGRAYLESRREEFKAEQVARSELECLARELEKALPALEWSHRFPEPGLYRGSALVPKAKLLDFRMAFMKLEFEPVPSLHGPFPAYSFASVGGLS